MIVPHGASLRQATVPAPSQALASRETPGNGPERRGARPALFSRPPHFVGRDAELAQLGQWWSTAQQGMRQVGFIVGEPGIGKTALVDAFVAQVAAAAGRLSGVRSMRR